MAGKHAPAPATRLASAVLAVGGVVWLLIASSAFAAAAHKPASKPAARSWSRPFTLAGPYENDVLAPQIAFSPTGEATVGFGVIDQDFPWESRAVIVTRSSSGKLGRPRRPPNAKELLSLAYDGSQLTLLTGNGPAALTCCDAAWTMALAGGRFVHQKQLVTGLGGAALGGLAALPKTRMLAAVATGNGVWVAQSAAPGRFRSNRRLTGSTAAPQALAVTSLPGGRSAVAWTEPLGTVPNVPASTIFLATGNGQRAPASARVALTASPGRGIDELSLAGGPGGPTAAWTESWYDRGGTYHSEAAVADLAGRPVARTFLFSGQLASGVTIAADAEGDEAMAWKTCDVIGSCTVRVTGRAAHGRFGAPQSLGSVDPGEAPAVAVGPGGAALVGWVSGGQVLVASRSGAGSRFGAPTTLSHSTEGYDVTVAVGPTDQALVAWTQGLAAPALLAAYRP